MQRKINNVGILYIQDSGESYRKVNGCEYILELDNGGIFYISEYIDKVYYSPTPVLKLNTEDVRAGKDVISIEGMLLRDKNKYGFYEYKIVDGDKVVWLETTMFDLVNRKIKIIMESDEE